jgi:hypothetical protein
VISGAVAAMAKHTKESHLGYALVFAALLALWYLNKKGLLHESVSSSIVTPDGTVLSDPKTGFPQYDSSDPQTFPPNLDKAVAPINGDGSVSAYPADPTTCSCPIGLSAWHDVKDNAYWCIPT